MRPLAAGFMKKYPFIKLTYYRADSEDLLAKLSAEIRSGNLGADVFEGSGGGEIAVEAGFTQPFHTPVLAHWPVTLTAAIARAVRGVGARPADCGSATPP